MPHRKFFFTSYNNLYNTIFRSCVAFGQKSRIMGVAARQQVNTNFKNTVINFKHLLGRKYSDPIAQLYKNFVPCDIVQLQNDNIGLKVIIRRQA